MTRSGGLGRGRVLPVVLVGSLLLLVWPGVTVLANYSQAVRDLERGTVTGCQTAVECTFQLSRPNVPSLRQLVQGSWNMLTPIASRDTLLFNGLITGLETLAGLGLALVVGVATATALVFSRAFERMLLPWIVASQNVPIIALAPMLAVILGRYGVQGVLPKMIVAAYIAYFPLTIGIASGLRSVSPLQLV